MDRKSAILIGLLCAALGLSACVAHSSQVSLRESAWLASDGQLEALSSERHIDREALYRAALNGGLGDAYPSPDDLRNDLLAGEFLFKAPLLLGGQAAKAGISCHSCHVNGTDNPHFLFPAISDAAGRADTTHSFFSKSLGNQVFDPLVIPDLTRIGKVDHSLTKSDLEDFLTTIVIGEFSSEAVSPRVIAPMATYVRALRLGGRLAGGDQNGRVRTRSLMRDLSQVRLMTDQSQHRVSQGEWEVAALLLSSAQNQTRSIHERLYLPSHAPLRDWLVATSREMGALRQQLNADKDSAQVDFANLQARLNAPPDFGDATRDSLYNPQVLAEALE